MIVLLLALAGCASKTDNAGPVPTFGTVVSSSPTPGATESTPTPGKSSPPAPQWPSPEDCISYNPATVTSHYEAGIYQINSGSTIIMRLHGGPGENLGDKGAALAKRYKKHCFIGRTNTRDEAELYRFDYWRDPSGSNPAIPDQEDDCSSYNKNNLTVENMGGSDGWRVKDHDHVLHLFDNETDAKNGKLVLSKYGKMCSIGGEEDPISYQL